MPDGKASILIVDDRPDKLLALEAVLEDLGQNIVRAYSGREALRHVLVQEFAVILLDVNMPGMDGFETASLIRQRKNSEHVPIIFITAFGDEMHAARGYSLGAVDYILAPVMPEVLRTKVAVFVDLFRKTQQLRLQTDWLRARADQLHKLTAASLSVNSALSMDEMLGVVTDTARQIIGAHQAGAIAVLAPGNNRVARASSFSEKYTGAQTCCHLMESADAHRLVRETGQAIRLTHAEIVLQAGWDESRNGVQTGHQNAGALTEPPMRGWLAAPLTGRDGRNMGLLQLSDRFEGDFNNDDEAVLVQLAQMASIALENSLYAEEREANRMKDEFLATLSHELRTPLNAILGWTQLLRSEDSSRPDAQEDIAHGLEVIERNARSQTKLIEDLLDVSRITTGKMRLNIRPAEIGPVVLAATDVVRPAVDAKQIKFECTMDDKSARTVIGGDPDRLQQVFWNLLSNAAKFTPAGGHIRCHLDLHEERLRFSVSDSGKGIDPKFLPSVFDRFRQADSSSTRSQGGLGIGLTIVRHIVELHGGTVHAQSEGDGKGSTFVVELPLVHTFAGAESPVVRTAAVRPAASSAALPSISGTRILLVDDEPDTREVIGQMLSRAGATVVSADSSRQAMEWIERAVPDILVSDIAMPEEDGYSLIRRVRSRAADAGGEVPAIALTAYAREEDRRRALASGFQDHLSKPVEPSDLVRAIARLTTDNQNGPAASREMLNTTTSA